MPDVQKRHSISPLSEPIWLIAATEAKKQCTGVAMTLAQRAKIVWCKNIVGCKIFSGAINIWYEYSLQPRKREKQRKRAATTLAQRAEAAQQQAAQQHQVKKCGAKNIIWWCGKWSTTGCTTTSETPVLLALHLATFTTCSCSTQKQLKLSSVKTLIWCKII